MREERGKPDFVLTINFGEKTYEANVRGCQKHLQYFWLVFEKKTFQTDTHWQCQIHTFRGKRTIPSTSLSPLDNKIFFYFYH